MKCIYPNRVTLATADEENANYPASNMTDDHPKKVWKATSKEAQIKTTVSAGADATALFGTNADTVVITIKDSTEVTTLWGPATYDLKGIDTVYELITDEGENWTSLWVDYTYQSSAHKIIYDVSLATGTVECGVIEAGPTRTFQDPQYGLQEGIIDYSIVKELNNGAYYIRARDKVKTFSGSVYAKPDDDFYIFMREVALEIGSTPIAWKISSNYSNHDWTVFARFNPPPNANHEFYSHSRINFSLLEVV